MSDEPDLAPRIYWAVAAAAVVVMALLFWLTQTFNIELGAKG